MEVTACCDRRAVTRVGLQRGFVAFIAPFYRGLAALLPGLVALPAQLEQTRAAWADAEADGLAEKELAELAESARPAGPAEPALAMGVHPVSARRLSA